MLKLCAWGQSFADGLPSGGLPSTARLESSNDLSALKVPPLVTPNVTESYSPSLSSFSAHKNWHRGVRYDSRPEAACGELLERLVPGFKVEEHKTFQIPIYDHEKGTTRFI